MINPCNLYSVAIKYRYIYNFTYLPGGYEELFSVHSTIAAIEWVNDSNS